MTGILPIARYNTQSALNNFNEYTILKSSNYSQYYGFTENEVKTLCENISLILKQPNSGITVIKLANMKSIIQIQSKN